jgi:hypothetical protein
MIHREPARVHKVHISTPLGPPAPLFKSSISIFFLVAHRGVPYTATLQAPRSRDCMRNIPKHDTRGSIFSFVMTYRAAWLCGTREKHFLSAAAASSSSPFRRRQTLRVHIQSISPCRFENACVARIPLSHAHSCTYKPKPRGLFSYSSLIIFCQGCKS